MYFAEGAASERRGRMGVKVETFGSWTGTLEVDEYSRQGDGRSNFTINTENPPHVVAEVQRVDEKNPFRLVVRQGPEPEKMGQD